MSSRIHRQECLCYRAGSARVRAQSRVTALGRAKLRNSERWFFMAFSSGLLLRLPRVRPAFLRLRSRQAPLKPEFSDAQQMVRVGSAESRAFRGSAAFRLLRTPPDHRLCPPGKLDRHVRWLSHVLIIQWMFIILRTAESERARLCATCCPEPGYPLFELSRRANL